MLTKYTEGLLKTWLVPARFARWWSEKIGRNLKCRRTLKEVSNQQTYLLKFLTQGGPAAPIAREVVVVKLRRVRSLSPSQEFRIRYIPTILPAERCIVICIGDETTAFRVVGVEPQLLQKL